MSRIKPALLEWKRKREAQGKHIMVGKTGKVGGEEFKRRVTGLAKAGFDKETAQKIVGAQYWRKAKEKFKQSRKVKVRNSESVNYDEGKKKWNR